jgi:hypothetical protein
VLHIPPQLGVGPAISFGVCRCTVIAEKYCLGGVGVGGLVWWCAGEQVDSCSLEGSTLCLSETLQSDTALSTQ